jgi:hypothetical protein
MKFKKLRIAWSVGWGLACVLLIALWVRSYTWMDSVHLPGNNSITSYRGQFLVNKPYLIVYEGPEGPNPLPASHYSVTSINHLLFGVGMLKGGLSIPIWLVAALICVAGSAVWIRKQFSLRALLIATTLFALALGMFVWLAHR